MPGCLTATLGAPVAALGLMEGLADGAAGGARLVGGALADDPVHRRSLAAGGYIGTAVLAALIGITGAVLASGAAPDGRLDHTRAQGAAPQRTPA